MRTLDLGTTEGGRWAALKRDVTTLRRVLMMIVGYWTHGRRVRKAYRDAEAAGSTYWVDEN